MRHPRHEKVAHIDSVQDDSLKRTTSQKKTKKRHLFFSQRSPDLGENLGTSH